VLRATIAKAQRMLDDAGLYRRDPRKFQTVTAALTKAEAELAAGEERWLDLEMLRETIEGV